MMKERLISIAQQAARMAGDHAHKKIHTAIATLKTSSDTKGCQPSEIVTQFDVECQELIIGLIQKEFPDHGFIAEEGTSGAIFRIPPRRPDGLWWIIDPIDGTRNFAHDLPHYCISIGAMQNGHPLLGVVYEPNTNTLFSAHIDGLATRNGQPIQALRETLHENSQVAVSGNIFQYLPHCAAQLLDHIVYMNIGSAALHFSYVAQGAYSAALGLTAKLWDIAAGAAIAQAAGATTRKLNGTPLFPIDLTTYHGEKLPMILATDPIQKQIQQIIG